MDKNILIGAYENALKIRSVEQIISENYHKGYMRCPTHLHWSRNGCFYFKLL